MLQLRMRDFKLDPDLVVDREMTEENNGKFILAFLVFSFVAKPGFTEFKSAALHGFISHFGYIRLNLG